MASQEKIEANRRNSMKSTGPKTQNGKSVAKMNALKHGLTSERVVIPGEDPAEFDELRGDLERELEPVGCQESDLVETIAICMWRRRRIFRMEANILAYEQAEKKHELAEREMGARRRELDRLYDRIESSRSGEENLADDHDDEAWEVEVDDETNKTIEELGKQYELAVEIFNDADEHLEKLSLGSFFLGFDKYSNALEKLLRYEAAIERSLARAQDQLRRLQRDREERAATQATVIDASDVSDETPA